MPIARSRRRPTSDWICREIVDAKAIDAEFSCDWCGTRIRWVHVLEHDDYSDSLNAGCCCAVRLCLDYDAEGAERELKNRTGRLMRFIDLRRWTRSRSNPANVWRWARLHDKTKVRVTVFQREGRYSIFIAGAKCENYCHQERFDTQAEALNVSFELIERLKESQE